MTNVSLARMTIKEVNKITNLTLEEAMDKFYTSNTASILYTLDTDLNTWTPASLARLVNEETEVAYNE